MADGVVGDRNWLRTLFCGVGSEALRSSRCGFLLAVLASIYRYFLSSFVFSSGLLMFLFYLKFLFSIGLYTPDCLISMTK